jgi:hypothetical protein
LELSYTLLQANGFGVKIGDVEFVDFAQKGKVYRKQKVRQQTLRHAQETAKAIVQLWTGI